MVYEAGAHHVIYYNRLSYEASLEWAAGLNFIGRDGRRYIKEASCFVGGERGWVSSGRVCVMQTNALGG